LDYGIKIARTSADFMVEGAADYMAENDNQSKAQKIIRTLKKHRGWMKHSDLLRHLSHSIPSYELRGLLASLCEAGQVEKMEIKPVAQGKPSVSYRLME